MFTFTINSSRIIPFKVICVRSEDFKNMHADYGFKKVHIIEKHNSYIPKSFIQFGIDNLHRELSQKRYGFLKDPYESYSKQNAIKVFKLRKSLKQLKFDDKNVWKRERSRDGVECPRSMLIIYYGICTLLDKIFENRPIDRFWFLETIARMPYLSYVSVIHLYETLGWWELNSDLKKIHYEEEANETFHLRIMESLGGDALWWNRFLARHVAMAYYGVLMIFFMISPRLAYLSSELLEMHAVDTYEEFYTSNTEILSNLPPTKESLEYLNTAQSLYDVFQQICNDEYQHAQQMSILKNKEFY
jgi:ubiquinol oxidase